jgi:replicative DNA helicase
MTHPSNAAAIEAYTPQMPAALVSQEAEQSVLGALLLDNAAFDRISNLTPEQFFNNENRLIWGAISALIVANKVADVITVHDYLSVHGRTDLLAYVNALASGVVSSANVRRHAEILTERHKGRLLMQVSYRAADIAQDGDTPVDDRIAQVQAEIGKLADQAAMREAVPLREAAVRGIERLQMRLDGKVRMFPTGLGDLDEMLDGGIVPGNLVILAARPSMGKTALALTVALNMSKDLGVGFLSMEMSEAELVDRAFASLGHVSLSHLKRPGKAPDVFWDRVTEGSEIAQSRNLYVDDMGGLTLGQVVAKARAMRRKYGIDVLVVDYLQLMSGTDSKQPRAYQLEEISRGLKALGKSLGIAVIALAQVNRKVEGGMPGLADLKDSGAIEQDADVVAFIHRPIQVDPELGEEWRYFAKLRVAKNRQGTTGDLALTYIGNETRFAGWSGPEPVKHTRTRGEL